MDIGTLPESTGIHYPASLAQTRFWLIDALDPGTAALNVAVQWGLYGPVDHARAEQAFRRIVARHEILRTALVEVDGVPVQSVTMPLPFRLLQHDLTALPPAERDAALDRLVREEARTPFALESPPLLRAALIALAPDSYRLMVTMHHTVCDGWSVGVVAAEFMAFMAGRPALPELPLQYGDYAEWQRAWLASPALDASAAYWHKQLAELPYVSVPPDHDADLRGPGAIASVLLPRALTDQLRATATRHGCTPFAVALAALGRVLQARTGAEDISIGTQVAGRTEVELEGMIGPFINTLVLRLDLSDAPDWDTLVGRAAAVVADALDHHAMPFERLIRLLNPARNAKRTPLFSVNLIFQRSFVAPDEGGGITLVDMPSQSAGALYDLNFFMVERPDGWRASCEYDSALFDPATVQAMLAQWQQALAGQTPAIQAATPAPEPVTDRLAAIWQEVLAVPAVAPEDGFFDLGGHSLLAARMLARVETTFGRRIGMAALFADPTLAGLADLLRDNDTSVLNPAGTGIPVAAIGPVEQWRGFSRAMGPRHSVICLAADALEAPALRPGPVAVLATGRDGPAALALAMSLQDQGHAVTLALVQAEPPRLERSGFWPRLWRHAAAPSFAGRSLLFGCTPSDGDATGGWARHLSGQVDLIPLPLAGWEDTVAHRLAEAAA